jgi:hypothetical protein
MVLDFCFRKKILFPYLFTRFAFAASTSPLTRGQQARKLRALCKASRSAIARARGQWPTRTCYVGRRPPGVGLQEQAPIHPVLQRPTGTLLRTTDA